MSELEKMHTTESPETCATQPLGRAMRLLGNVSPRTVSQRLKMLEETGFVKRQAYPEIPPRVEYSLTEKGMALVDIMEAIKRFGEQYLSDAPAQCEHS